MFVPLSSFVNVTNKIFNAQFLMFNKIQAKIDEIY